MRPIWITLSLPKGGESLLLFTTFSQRMKIKSFLPTYQIFESEKCAASVLHKESFFTFLIMESILFYVLPSRYKFVETQWQIVCAQSTVRFVESKCFHPEPK